VPVSEGAEIVTLHITWAGILELIGAGVLAYVAIQIICLLLIVIMRGRGK
jgi:hypothetical protein